MSDNRYRPTGGSKSNSPQEYFSCNSVSQDTVFAALSDRHRRVLLSHLSEMADTMAERSQLVKAIRTASKGEKKPPKDAVALELHHNHLPRLDDGGFIDYDSQQGAVRNLMSSETEEWINNADYKKSEPLP